MAWRPSTITVRSVRDLDCTIRQNLHRLPKDIGLVVGVPRSGMLPASLLSNYLNVPLVDLEGFLRGSLGSTGMRLSFQFGKARARVLLVDDSIATGRQMSQVKKRVANEKTAAEVCFLAVFGTTKSPNYCDHVFSIVDPPRIFTWNAVNSWALERSCVDIDGLLCPDPDHEQNDDGDRYAEFLTETPKLYGCRNKIGHLVTARLEKYRPQTEKWLERHSIEYEELHMWDIPSADDRNRLGNKAHANYKARIYRELQDTWLFLESSPWQAPIIAQKAAKSVICVEDGKCYRPSKLSVRFAQARYYQHHPRELMSLMKSRLAFETR